ncbi:MAG: antibiotic biosynthesis monooxygenase [Spirochaetaceae bacterium]|nr:MAG: antibiotic biosynthesis monooxygenase [Spirochaetaceae bacterium]
MIVRLIRVHVRPDAVEAFEEATRLNHQGSIAEPGVLRFDVLRSPSDPGQYVLYEVYATHEATVAHKETAHYTEWKSTVEAMMAAPRESEVLEVVAPVDERAWRVT